MNATEQQNPPAANPVQSPTEPVLGVTTYERVTALLLTLIFTLGGLTLAFGGLWAANQRWPTHPALSPILNQPTAGTDDDFGGDPDGEKNAPGLFAPGIPGEDPSSQDDPDRPTADSPALEQILNDLKKQFAESLPEFDQLEPSDLPRSILATGSDGKGDKKKLGTGPGDKGGTETAKRWEIIFESGLTEIEYARQLDFFNIQLTTFSDGKWFRVSGMATTHPTVQVGAVEQKGGCIFFWRDAGRRQVDLSLIRKAKELTVADDSVVAHFYPREIKSKLLAIETAYAAAHGHPDLHDVAKTKFIVKRTENGYDFEIAKQTYLVQKSER